MDKLEINARLRVYKNAVVHINRLFPANKCRLNVAVGQQLSPAEIIGQGFTPVGFRTIHLSKEMGVPPKQAHESLRRKIGETIYQGELLAEGRDLMGLRRKVLTSPTDGVLDLYDNRSGNLRIKLVPKKVKLISGVYGIVDQVDAEKGVILIRTLADLVYGVLGSGREREGVIRVLGSAEDLISSKQIPEHVQKNILVGGSLILQDALQKMASVQVGGIISGGINATDFKTTTGGKWHLFSHGWSDVGVTLMVTEGFGSIPMGEDIFAILKKHDGKFAVLDGNRSRLILPINDPSSMIYICKTKLPFGSFDEPAPELATVELKVGMRVRVISPPTIGSQGIVEAIDRSLTTLPSGLSAVMVTVVASKQKLRVPYFNLEMIG